jgi:hypothetical protein
MNVLLKFGNSWATYWSRRSQVMHTANEQTRSEGTVTYRQKAEILSDCSVAGCEIDIDNAG